MSDEANIPWRCFYCGEVFTEEAEARTHFGFVESLGPGCVDKMRTDEKLRLSIVRKLESEIRRLMREAEELDHKAGAYVGMQMELARYFGTCGGAPVKTVSQAWLVHEAMIGRAEAAEVRADKAEDLKNRYKAAFKRWIGFCKDWRARSDRWQEVAAQGELQLRELPTLKESYRKALNLWHAWFPGCCCEVDMPCPEHDKTEVEIEAMGIGWGHPDALRSLQDQVKRNKAENATLRASLREAQERVEALEKDLATLKSGGCVCWQEAGGKERSHTEHCPEQAAVLMRRYCDRIKELRSVVANTRLSIDSAYSALSAPPKQPSQEAGKPCPTCHMPGVPHQTGCRFGKSTQEGAP